VKGAPKIQEKTMVTQTHAAASSALSPEDRQKVQELRGLFAGAPDTAKTALEDVIGEAVPDESAAEGSVAPVVSAGRIGLRQGKVSELTFIAPLSPDGAKRLRAALNLLHGNAHAADRVGTVHDMRFAFLDNDTKLLFATAYDGDWDNYIDDFATKIPAYMDLLFSAIPEWPGIRDPSVKDVIAKYQIQVDAWYVANPGLTVAETRRLERVGKALDEFLDKVS